MSGKDYFSSGSELILSSVSPWVHGEVEPYGLVNVWNMIPPPSREFYGWGMGRNGRHSSQDHDPSDPLPEVGPR